MLRSENVPSPVLREVVERELVLEAREIRGDDVAAREGVLRVVGAVDRDVRARRDESGAARVMVGTPLLVVREGALR